MAKDDRIWAKFTVDMPDNPKVLPLSDAAFRCLVEATMYSRRMMSDGFLATRLAVAKWGLEPLQELCTNDTEKPSFVEVEGGYLIHDFTEHQETKAEIEAKRKRNAANGSKGGRARANRLATDSLSESQAETETETETEESSSTKKIRPKSRGSRLNPDWLPSADDVAAIRSECPDVDPQLEHRVFVDYWLSTAGARGVRTSWGLVWRNWMRRAQKDISQRGQKQTPEQRARQTLRLATDIDLKGIEG